MKKVAPELDSLMWTLAEDVNERAVDEFGTRHPGTPRRSCPTDGHGERSAR